MRILLVINRPSREAFVMEAIKQEILKINHNAIVEVRQRFTPKFNKFVFKFKPNVILTYPFTSETLSRWFYLFKMFLGSKIICFRTEGVMDFQSSYELERFVGYDSYGKELVDYELSWGEKFARVVGGELVKRGKLYSLKQFKVVGHPRLESYFNDDLNEKRLPSRIVGKLSKYEKNKVVLFITGFVMADYTRDDMFNAKDMGGEDRINDALEGAEIIKKFRIDWIDNIISAANKNPNALFIVKKHPLEKKQDYMEQLSGENNILYVYEDIQMSDIIPYAGVYFHYGSTSLIDAYLSQVASIYVSSKNNKGWYSDLGWPSTKSIDVESVIDTVNDFLMGNIFFENSDEIRRVKKEMFNLVDGKEYKPSKEIAEIIMEATPPKRIKITDPYFLKALLWVVYAYSLAPVVVFLRKAYSNILTK